MNTNKKNCKKTVIGLLMFCTLVLICFGIIFSVFANTEITSQEKTLDLFTFTNENDKCELHESEPFNLNYSKKSKNTTMMPKGALVNLSELGTATLSEVLDFKAIDGTVPFAEFYVLPSRAGVGTKGSNSLNKYELGTTDVGRLSFVLTDCYDENNYVKLDLLNADNWFMYVMTGSRTNTLAGWSYETKADGTPAYRIIANGRFGTGIRYSLTNVHYSADQTGEDWSTSWIRLYFDNNTNCIYVETYATPYCLVLDLDDSSNVPELWEGFSDGRAKLSLSCSQFTGGSPAQILFTKINGRAIDSAYSTDTIEPDVLIDYMGYDENELPTALVGTAYTLLPFTVRDSINMGVQGTVSVSHAGQDVAITDNSFVPSEAGDYLITYKAIDYFGNSSTKTIKVIAKSEIAPIYFGIDSTEIKFTCAQGEKNQIADCVATSGSGIPSIESFVSLSGTNKRVKVENGAFIADEAGEYVVTYIIKDYLGRTLLKHYTVKCEQTNTPIYTDDVILPKYMITGNKYIMPELIAKEYSTGVGKDIVSSISISVEGEVAEQNGNVFTLPVGKAGTAEIIYTAQANGETATKKYYIPVVDATYDDSDMIDPSKLFVLFNGAETQILEKSVSVSLLKNSHIEFVNKINTNSSKLNFEVPQELNYSSLTFMYVDSCDPTKQLKFTYHFAEEGKKATFSVNGGVEYKLTDIVSYSLEFNDSTCMVNPEGKTSIQITKWLDGSSFNGFIKKSAYLTIYSDGVSAKTEFNILSIGGQVLRENTVDMIGPNIVLLGSKQTRLAPGSDAVICSAVAYDMLSGYSNITTSFYKKEKVDKIESKVYLKDQNGIEIKGISSEKEYVVKNLTEGAYFVDYEAVDGNGVKRLLSFSLTVYDNLAPTIKLQSTPAISSQVGKEYKLPEAKVQDNIDGEIAEYYIYVLNANGYYQKIENNIYSFDKAGEYKFVYLAFDSTGNVGRLEYIVAVK